MAITNQNASEDKNDDAKLLTQLLSFEIEEDVPFKGPIDPVNQQLKSNIEEHLISNDAKIGKSLFFPQKEFGDLSPKDAQKKVRNAAAGITEIYKGRNQEILFSVSVTVKSEKDPTPGIRIWRRTPKPKPNE